MDTREILDRVSLVLGTHPEDHLQLSVFALRGRADFLLAHASRGPLDPDDVSWQVGRIVFHAVALCAAAGVDLDAALAAALTDAEERRLIADACSARVTPQLDEVAPWPTTATPAR